MLIHCNGVLYFSPRQNLLKGTLIGISFLIFAFGKDVVYLPAPAEAEPVTMPAPMSGPVNFTEVEHTAKKPASSFRTSFVKQKQKLIFEYTASNGVSRLDQLSDSELLNLNRKISQLFKETVLPNLNIEPHVLKYFTDTIDLYKLETSLMEQAKFHVPASIKLAQSALETAWGRRVIHNNYFGIKDKTASSGKTTTSEFYNEAEFKRNRYKVISWKKVNVNGRQMYKCRINDHFKAYHTPWQSFRDHSVYLSTNRRYAPLFTGGKKFEAWAEKIGSSKDGGVGYATSPVYGNLLKSIIRKYHLDLLDH